MSKTTYNRRKEQGLCVICGKTEPRQGGVTCEKCLEKQRNYQRETRQFYREIGICPRCGTNKLFGDEKTCPECLAREAVIRKKSRGKLKKTDAEYARENQERLKKLGLCRTGCGRKRAEGHTYCETCLVKHRERNQKKRQENSLNRSERPSYGLCYTCGKALDREGGICVKCAEIMTKNLPKTRDNKYWRNSNDVVFSGKE